jgi:hypothetical protein
VSRVLSVVLMGRDTGHPHLLAPNLLTGGKGADLVIRGNVVLNREERRGEERVLESACNAAIINSEKKASSGSSIRKAVFYGLM